MRILLNHDTGAGLSAMMEACLAVTKPNSTVGPIVLKAVINIAPRRHPSTAAAKGNDEVDDRSLEFSKKVTIDVPKDQPSDMEYLDSEGEE